VAAERTRDLPDDAQQRLRRDRFIAVDKLRSAVLVIIKVNKYPEPRDRFSFILNIFDQLLSS
jgi:hypothetical protein